MYYDVFQSYSALEVPIEVIKFFFLSFKFLCAVVAYYWILLYSLYIVYTE